MSVSPSSRMRATAGFSLLELMMVTGLIAMTSMATFAIMSATVRSNLRTASSNDISDIARQIMEDLKEDAAGPAGCVTGLVSAGGPLQAGTTDLLRVRRPTTGVIIAEDETITKVGQTQMRITQLTFRPHAAIAGPLKTNAGFTTSLYELLIRARRLNADAAASVEVERTVNIEATFDAATNLTSCRYLGVANDGRSFASLPIANNAAACGATQTLTTPGANTAVPTCAALPRYNSTSTGTLVTTVPATTVLPFGQFYDRPPGCLAYEQVMVDGTTPCTYENPPGNFINETVTETWPTTTGRVVVNCGSNPGASWFPSATMTLRCGRP